MNESIHFVNLNSASVIFRSSWFKIPFKIMKSQKYKSWNWIKWQVAVDSTRKNSIIHETNEAQAEHVIQKLFLSLMNLI